MAIHIPIIIGGATVAAGCATYSLLSSDAEEEDGTNSQTTSCSTGGSSGNSRSTSRNSDTGNKAALRKLRLERNEAAMSLAARHNIALPDNHLAYRKDCPAPLFQLLERRAEKRKEELREPVENLQEDIDKLEGLSEKAEALQR